MKKEKEKCKKRLRHSLVIIDQSAKSLEANT